MAPAIEQTETELAWMTPAEQLAAIDEIEKRRKHDKFICYWKPYETGNQHKIFKSWGPTTKTLLVRGGNRSGKSESGAPIAVAWALGKEYFRDEPAWEWVKDLPIPEPPSTIWIVGLDFPTVKNVLWYEKLRNGKDHPGFVPTDQGVIRKISESDFQIYFKNGSVITCKSAEAGREKFQGASVDLVWIDEEPDAEIYHECLQRTLDCSGKILVTVTPLLDIASGVSEPWVYDLHEDAMHGRKDVTSIALSVLDNPFVPQEEKDRAKAHWAGKPDERARLYGDFVRRSGLVYPEWTKAKHIIRPIPLPRNWKRVACIDPSHTGTTACLWAAVHPNGDLYLYREYYESNQVASEHARNILVRNEGDLIDIWLIDPKLGSQRNAETFKTVAQLYRDAGIPVRLAHLPEDYGLSSAREYIAATTSPTVPHAKVFVFDNLDNFRWEIEHYVWDFYHSGPLKGTSKEKPRKRHDHLLNSFQYICGHRFKGRNVYTPSEDEKRLSILNNSYTSLFPLLWLGTEWLKHLLK